MIAIYQPRLTAEFQRSYIMQKKIQLTDIWKQWLYFLPVSEQNQTWESAASHRFSSLQHSQGVRSLWSTCWSVQSAASFSRRLKLIWIMHHYTYIHHNMFHLSGTSQGTQGRCKVVQNKGKTYTWWKSDNKNKTIHQWSNGGCQLFVCRKRLWVEFGRWSWIQCFWCGAEDSSTGEGQSGWRLNSRHGGQMERWDRKTKELGSDWKLS